MVAVRAERSILVEECNFRGRLNNVQAKYLEHWMLQNNDPVADNQTRKGHKKDVAEAKERGGVVVSLSLSLCFVDCLCVVVVSCVFFLSCQSLVCAIFF